MPEPFVIAFQSGEKLEIALLFLRNVAVELPHTNLLFLINVRKQMVGIHVILVNLVEIFGHLRG